MPNPKKEHPEIKPGLHVNNRHRNRYDFKQLIGCLPELSQFVKPNKFGDESIDFSSPVSVMMLNRALLKFYYAIDNWDIPPGYLCPPIPGRADYIHHIADLLAESNGGKIPSGDHFRCLDIGAGANCIYPIIGHRLFGWSFVGSEVDPVSVTSAQQIIESNNGLIGKIEIRRQENRDDIFYGIIRIDERFDLTICNPPFHTSLAEAQTGTLRKLNNLNAGKIVRPVLNFGGQSGELWCQGGEERFVKNMIRQSKQFYNSCFWYTTFISKQSNLKSVYTELKSSGALEVRTIPMSHGNKQSRIVAWTFLTPIQQKNWIRTRWNKL